jgi:8-oxo-dGTP diphosphatase
MKRKGTSIIFVNDQKQILLFLRDDKPGLPYRNMWDIPGGHVEDGETPEQCIVREMKEEMDLTLKQFELLSVKEFDDRIEYTFWKKVDFNIENINLHEGQRLKWFTEFEAKDTKLAYGFNQIINDFFKKPPFNSADW